MPKMKKATVNRAVKTAKALVKRAKAAVKKAHAKKKAYAKSHHH
jgi:hypothetical protein